MTNSSTITGQDSATAEQRTDLRERTAAFAKHARSFVLKTPRTIASLSDCRQLLRSSGAIGASYLAADDAPTRQEFINTMRECCQQAKQSSHWLTLLDANLEERSETARQELAQEAGELERIFGAIVGKVLAKAKAEKQEKGEE